MSRNTHKAQCNKHQALSILVPLATNRRWRPDVGACYPAVKAAIDGIVDAGVLDDDNPDHLLYVTFYPVEVIGRDGLRLTITEIQ